jgi:hypothetical protein
LPDNLAYGGAWSPPAAGKVQLHPWFYVAPDRFPEGQKLAFSSWFKPWIKAGDITHAHIL